MNRWWWSLLVTVSGLLISLHLWQLADIPHGLYLDETSIGVNAAAIAQNGHDEHGYKWPLYFKAFGEYKNPIYIYATALIFKFGGLSDFTLRLAGPLFLALALVGTIYLSRLLWPKEPIIVIYLVLSVGLVPWFWPMSRIAFETISQLPAWIWTLVWLHIAYERDKETKQTPLITLSAFLFGLTAGISVYTYSTSRLLIFLLMISWLALYVRPRVWRNSLLSLGGFAVALIPYTYFALKNPGALTSRFNVISYVGDSSLTISDKVQLFIVNYARQFSPEFLMLHGDHNLRHATSYGGEVYYVVAFLALMGLIWACRLTTRPRTWKIFFILNLLMSPVAAALTTGDTGHSLRTVPEGVLLILVSAYGLQWLVKVHLHNIWRRLTYLITISVLLIQASLYLTNYFTTYAVTSAPAFESYNLKGALRAAVDYGPERLLVTDAVPSIHLAWYRLTIPNLKLIPMISLNQVTQLDNSCLISTETEAASWPNICSEQPIMVIRGTHSYFKTRCF